MTVEELNKLIKEELSAFLEAEDELETVGAEDDIEITTDEPEMGTGDEAIDLLRQIYDLIKPEIEGEAGEEVELEDEETEEEDIEDEEIGDGEDDEEGLDEIYPNYKADQVQKVKYDSSDVSKGLNESKLNEMDPLAMDGLSNTGNALSQLTGIPMTHLIVMLVMSIPIVYILTVQGVIAIQKMNVPGFVKRAAMKAAAIFQKSGKSGEAISSEVEALQSKGEIQASEAMSGAEGMNESLDNFTDEEKMKFIKDFNAGSGMMNESVKTRRNNRKLNESRQLRSRFQKLANIKK